MRIKDRDFKPFITEAELDGIVRRLAGEISRDYKEGDLVACPILTGAFMFAADLLRRLTVPCEVEFVRYTSYCGMSSTGEVNCALPFPTGIEGRDLLIVEDVVDTGLSMQHILTEVQALRPRSVKVCALFFKPAAFKGNYKVDYVGREIGNEFIVGYGLDYDEQGRTLPEVMIVENEK
ncbi:MAG: hypoxanthine phosphoribosyltransferase [Bacteroidales bacterium]|nr:hypoxanthine phosphoribosyltransferase [Bacteroidales bacterium]